MKKKICFFLPNLSIGGAEKVIANIANLLAVRSYEIDIVTVNSQNVQIDNINEKINIINLNKKKTILSLWSFFLYLTKNNPDIVFSTFNNTSFISAVAKLIYPNKFNLIIRIPVDPLFNLGLLDICYKFINFYSYYVAKKIIVPSSEMYNKIINDRHYMYNKYHYIQNPLNIDYIEKRAHESEYDFTIKKYILCIGRLEKQKDFNTLINAFKKVREKHDIELVILGEGSARQEIEKKIFTLGLNKYIFMPGFVKNPYYYINKCEVFVLSSYAEGSPNSLQQAISLGKKIVATDCDYGPKELLENGKLGTLVSVGDIQSMSDAISNMILSDNISKITDSYKKKYSDQYIIEKYLNLFDEMYEK